MTFRMILKRCRCLHRFSQEQLRCRRLRSRRCWGRCDLWLRPHKVHIPMSKWVFFLDLHLKFKKIPVKFNHFKDTSKKKKKQHPSETDKKTHLPGFKEVKNNLEQSTSQGKNGPQGTNRRFFPERNRPCAHLHEAPRPTAPPCPRKKSGSFGDFVGRMWGEYL